MTEHSRQIFIFSFQFFCALHSHMVPLTSQQNLPALYSYAGHSLRLLGGHFFITQQGFASSFFPLFRDSRKNTCLSTCVGIERHPCS